MKYKSITNSKAAKLAGGAVALSIASLPDACLAQTNHQELKTEPLPTEVWIEKALTSALKKLNEKATNCTDEKYRALHEAQCWRAIEQLNGLLKHDRIQEIQKHYIENKIKMEMHFHGNHGGN